MKYIENTYDCKLSVILRICSMLQSTFYMFLHGKRAPRYNDGKQWNFGDAVCHWLAQTHEEANGDLVTKTCKNAFRVSSFVPSFVVII